MLKCPTCENDRNEFFKPSFLPKCYQCGVCGSSFVFDFGENVYAEEYFSEKEKPSLIARISVSLLSFFYVLRVGKIKKLLSDKENPIVLDYGCGAGKLVEALIKQGINATGFEPSEGARIITQKKNLPVYNEIKPIEGGYDLVMFWHSLEHTEKPLETLNSIKNNLAIAGKILIAVPNADSLEAKIFKENWFHYSYPFHLIHFTPKSAKIMLQKSGFYLTSIDFWNPEYTISGLVQSFLNWFLPKDALYSIVSHRHRSWPLSKAVFWAGASLILSIIFLPALILFFLIELMFSKTGAIIIVAEKSQKHEN